MHSAAGRRPAGRRAPGVLNLAHQVDSQDSSDAAPQPDRRHVARLAKREPTNVAAAAVDVLPE